MVNIKDAFFFRLTQEVLVYYVNSRQQWMRMNEINETRPAR